MRGWLALRDAWRSLRSTPAATAFVLAILTMGIAAATITFSVVDAVVLRPLPFPNPHRLIDVAVRSEQFSTVGRERIALPVFLFEQLGNHSNAFESIAAVTRGNEQLAGNGGPVPVLAARVTANLFDVLGVKPMLGSGLSAEHEVEGNDRVAVIGNGLWQGHFGGDPSVIGRPLELARGTVTVIGVMPAGFSYPLSDDRRPELWTPFVAPADQRSGEQLSYYLHVVGRLAPDTTLAAAQAEANALLASLALSGPSRLPEGLQFAAEPLADSLIGSVRNWMLMVLAAVSLVLLVACANVANVRLTRVADRARELAIRASIGASRRLLMGSMLAESLALSLAAAALSLLIAAWGIGTVQAALPADIARASDIALDLRVYIAALTAALVTGLMIGLVPAWSGSRLDLVSVLKDGTAGAGRGRTRWRSGFLVAEVAFVVLLLVGTTLFVTSFVKVSLADLGFERRNLLLASASGLPTPVSDVLRELERVPGVARAGAFTYGAAPLAIAGGFGGGQSGTQVRRPGAAAESAVFPLFLGVTPGYFGTSGIQIVSGRDFAGADLGTRDVVVLDVPTARRLFGDDDPVGATVLYGDDRETRVVGVVAGVRDRGPESPATPTIYFPSANGRGHEYLVRVEGEVATAMTGITTAFDRLRLAGSPVARVRVLEDAFRSITASRRFAAGLMSMFGLMAVVLGAAGIFGVMASIVAQRRREFGIRVALGATAATIVGGVLAWAGRHLLAGLVVGLFAAFLLSRSVTSLFYEVSPGDAWVYVAVACVSLVAGLAAAAVPARRAARVDPLTTLRVE